MTRKKKSKKYSPKLKKFELTSSLIVILLVLIFVLFGIIKIALSNKITELNYRYDILKRREIKYSQQVAELQTDITELSRPGRIRKYAKKHLEMVDHNSDIRVLVVD
ncbi:MAG: hypothetical protein KAI81_04595 [Candidatus Marinimicrobia bacterium]|nr:hypothetical protein [Candidatus Neomarinimicrobiota bacterium]